MDKLKFWGYKEEVTNAKVDATLCINEKINEKNAEYTHLLITFKEIQWLHQLDNGNWKSFPLHANSIIETAYQKKNLHVSFDLRSFESFLKSNHFLLPGIFLK